MAAGNWKAFPYDADAYRYEGAALKKAWGELHRGDGKRRSARTECGRANRCDMGWRRYSRSS